MATGKAHNGKLYAGNPHVRFDESEVASMATPRCESPLYKHTIHNACKNLTLAVLAMAAAPFSSPPTNLKTGVAHLC